MFLEYYGLREQPFGVTPDPKFLFWSHAHREALASLFYGIENDRGFMALIAPPGMGKTTLLFQLLGKLSATARTAFLFQTQCDSREFLRYLMADLGCPQTGDDLVTLHGQLNEILIEEARQGRRFVVAIDEAQNLDASVLETIRLLTNFETPGRKLLQVILSGQPQLEDKLAHPDLAQLRQRVSIISRLAPLPKSEIDLYIAHRLEVAGYTGAPLFSAAARSLIGEHSAGIPRTINNLCFHSLSLGCATKGKAIDEAIVREAIADLELQPPAPEPAAEVYPSNLTSTVTSRSPLVGRSNNIFKIQVAAAMLFLSIAIVLAWLSYHGAGVPDAAIPSSSALPVVQAQDGIVAPETTAGNLPSAAAGIVESAPPAPVLPPPPGSYTTITIERDDYLLRIVPRYLNRRLTPQLLEEILRLNPKIVNPNRILAGTKLRLPLRP